MADQYFFVLMKNITLLSLLTPSWGFNLLWCRFYGESMNENTEWMLAVGVENKYGGGARGVSRAPITNASNMYPGASLHLKDIPGGEANLSNMSNPSNM